jgi:hypothetical protein
LQQPHAGKPLLGRALEHGKHQPATNPSILQRGIDGDRTYPADRTPLVEEIAADNPPVHLGDHRVEARISQQSLQQPDADFRRRQIPRKVVLARYRFERLEADRAANLGILGHARAKDQVHAAPLTSPQGA